MRGRNAVRVVLLAAVLLPAGALASAWMAAPSDLTTVALAQTDQPYEDRAPVAPPRDGTTVVTTDPPGGGNTTAAIVAVGPDGRVRYANDTYDNYFDVDPSPAGADSVLYVAGSRYGSCPPALAAEADFDAGDGCALVAVERANLSTGATTRIHTAVTPWDIWHDVDRLDETRLLVADIAEDRVFVLNTTTGSAEWTWNAEDDLPPSSGGHPDDWTHVNDVEVLEDGRIMVSLRNHDRVAFLDREAGLIEEDTLGAEDDYDVLYEQHNPDYVPEDRGGPAVVVADSENNRVVEYQRASAGWVRSWTWRDAELRWPRDADRLPDGNTLVTDSQGNRVLEVTTEGHVAWSVTVSTPYEAERLGTGDESATGRSMRAVDATAQGDGDEPAVVDDGDGQPGPITRAIAFVAGPVVNGILYVAPPWFTVGDLPALALLLGSVLAWTVLEVRWSPYRVRSLASRVRSLPGRVRSLLGEWVD